jgi:acyl carrier protein
MTTDELKVEITQLIIDALKLEDLSIEDVDPQMPLFGEGLGLDSIDALELGIALQKKYNIKIDSNDEHTKQQFATVETLAKFVQDHRGEIA